MEHVDFCTEWQTAQTVLVGLVRALAPLTGNDVSLALKCRFPIPKPPTLPKEPLNTHHSVELLSTLTKAQQWIEQLSPLEPPISSSNPQEPSVTKQAKRMVTEIQQTIAHLASSIFLKNPQEKPLKQALGNLKPHLDDLIEAVTRQQMGTTDEPSTPFRAPQPFKHLLEARARQQMNLRDEHPAAFRAPFPQPSQRFPFKKFAEKGERGGESVAKVPRKPPEQAAPLPSFFKGIEKSPLKQEVPALFQEPQPTSAPYLTQPKPLFEEKKKKKKKGQPQKRKEPSLFDRDS